MRRPRSSSAPAGVDREAGLLRLAPLDRSVRRRLLAAAAVLAWALGAGAGPGASAAQAAEYGMSDGRPILFASPHLHALDFKHVRLVLPWNAAYGAGEWWEWLDRARAQGFQVLVAPTIDKPRDCDTGSCTGPTPAEYRAALEALLDKQPSISAVESWNEPNHGLQPTWRNARLAAAYYEQARAACEGRCTAVAGNMLDGPSLPDYLTAYRAALTTEPAVWGLHNYFDATYFQRTGVDLMLSVAKGPVWLTETGGLVTFRSSGGTLPYDEHRAADSLRWLFTLVQQTPRIERTYLYGMWQQPWNTFDSALIRVDNTERESMQVVRAYVGKRKVQLPGEQAPLLDDPYFSNAAQDPPGAVAPGGVSRTPAGPRGSTLPESAGRLRVMGKRIEVASSRRVAVTIRCIGSAPCAGRVELGAGPWTYRRGVALAAGGATTVRVRLPRAAVKRVNPHLPLKRAAWAAVCDGRAACATAARVKLRRR